MDLFPRKMDCKGESRSASLSSVYERVLLDIIPSEYYRLWLIVIAYLSMGWIGIFAQVCLQTLQSWTDLNLMRIVGYE